MIAACPFPSHQGTQVFIRHLANALAGAGHAVHLLTYGESEPLAADLDARIALHRAPTLPVGLRSGPSFARLAADAALLRHTLKLLATRDIDVLHVHNVEGLSIGVVASRLIEVPLVYHAHTRLESELPLYARTGIGRRAARVLGTTFERTFPKAAKAVICFDGEQAARFKHAGVSPARLHVIPLGLAMNELAQSGTPGRAPAAQSPRIAYAGNPDPYQNLELLRDAFSLLRQRTPELTLGLISNHPRETFGRLAGDPGVEHVGYTSPHELATQLRACRVGLVTRTLEVGAPVKALTYLSAGMPVVACSARAAGLLGAVPEVCALTDATAEAVAAGAERFLDQPPPHRDAFERARRAFDIQEQVAAYDAVYSAL
jgi:glycosyltransferase involved in cell wall biosynthesis